MPTILHDFLLAEPEPRPALIGRGILPERTKLIIGGAPKIGKSYIVLNVALGLASGTPLFGAKYRSGVPVFPVPHAVRVLYVEQEIGDSSLRKRLRALITADHAAELELYLKSRDTKMRMDTPEGRDFLDAEIGACKPRVVIIDPLAKFHLSDENSAQHMGAVMRVADHWIEEHGCAVIIVHHTGHPNPQFPRRGGDRLRGSTAVYGDADTIISVDRQSPATTKEPIFKLDFETRHDEPLEPVYIKKLKSGMISYLGEDYGEVQTRELAPAAYKDL